MKNLNGLVALLLLVAVCVGFSAGYEFCRLFGQDNTYVYSSGIGPVEYRTNKGTGILQSSGPNGWQ